MGAESARRANLNAPNATLKHFATRKTRRSKPHFSGVMSPGNANLPAAAGVMQIANREIGVPGLPFSPHRLDHIMDAMRSVGYSRGHAAIVREGLSGLYCRDHPSEISGAWLLRASHCAKNLCDRSGWETGFRRRRIRSRGARGDFAASTSRGGQLSLVGIGQR